MYLDAAPSTRMNHATAHAIPRVYENRAIARELLAFHARPTLRQPACSTWPPGPAFPTRPIGSAHSICPSGYT
eukprot:9413386-Pyramimonas_sp.AAC.1